MDKAKIITFSIIGIIIILGVMNIIKLNKRQKELEKSLSTNKK